jgi:ankyrin repeat protein
MLRKFFIIIIGSIVLNCKNSAKYELIEAARNGQIGQVKKLIEGGSDPNQKDVNNGKAILHYFSESSASSSESIVLYLMGFGANINLPDAKGQTALFYSVSSGNLKMTSELIHHGADLNIKNNLGETPIFHAANLEIIRLLHMAGANIFETDNEGKNLLHVSKTPSISSWLIEHGVNYKHRDMYGKTPLDYSTAEILKTRDEILNQYKKKS